MSVGNFPKPDMEGEKEREKREGGSEGKNEKGKEGIEGPSAKTLTPLHVQ